MPPWSATDLMERFRLDGKTAVVTGASSGLGAGFSIALGLAGANVVLAARRQGPLTEIAERVRDTGSNGLAVRADISSVSDCERVVQVALDEFGAVDVLVNNAGVGTAVPATRETQEQFRSVIEVNLMGSYWMAQACGRAMGPGSSIVNISSVLGITTAGLPQAAYSSSKAAILGLTRDLAQQWTGRKGIRVNALLPGYFVTEMTQQYEAEYAQSVIERTLVGRPGKVIELCSALLFLASDASSYITGTTLVVDGGFTVS